jgi:ankyrin repeat protein
MAEYLISNGADPNLGRNPPLHYAARFGRPQMVQLLLRHGADVLKVHAEKKKMCRCS